MSDADAWFHEQLTCIQAGKTPQAHDVPPAPDQTRAHADSRRSDMVLAGLALAALIGAFTIEAARGPMRADQPFGLKPPPAVFRASMAVNGRAPAAPIQDRNATAMTGIGVRR